MVGSGAASLAVRGLPLDHLVWAAPNLAQAVEEFERLTGIQPAPGGVHPSWGTANYLAGLGKGAYLEVIGPDPDQPDPEFPRPFGIDALDAPRLVTWAVRTGDMHSTIEAARAAGYDPGPPTRMSRTRADGVELSWSLTAAGQTDWLVPFLIDWGSSEHPSLQELPQLELVALEAVSPAPAEVERALDALGVSLPVWESPVPGLAATVRSPAGEVVLR